MNESKISYMAMGAFVTLGIISALYRDYGTAAMNIALGVAIGGSGQKPWKEQTLIPKVLITSFLLISIALFAFVIITDYQAN